jgi:hypothetical protein
LILRGCSLLRRAMLLGGGIFSRCPILRLFAMMLDDASGGGAKNGMVAGHVPGHAAHGCAFEASFGRTGRGKQRERRNGCGSDEKIAHFVFPPDPFGVKTRLGGESCT